ncbi:MAG: T9SS type A sorting domain-containing protein, partial [Saprospiraceae bacterium]|nr:T9SS type A sorting domain-containing protein [Saprospiraceae bacterium]
KHEKILSFILIFAAFANVIFAQTDIANARTYAQGQTLTITGTVINNNDLGPIRYLQDATAGLAVYAPGTSDTWNEGDNITVTGTMGEFNGLIQIVNPTASTVNSTGNALPTPTVITPSQMAAHESELVTINSATFANPGGTFTNGTLAITAGGQSSVVYLRSGHPLIGSTIPLSPVNLTGVASQFSGTPQLLPRNAGDIDIASAFYLTTLPEQSAMTQTGFALNWNTNIAGSTKIIYGTDATNLNQTLDLGGSTTTHTATLTGLTAGTIYYAQAISNNGTTDATSTVEAYATVSTSSGHIDIHFNFPVDNSIATFDSANHAIPAHLELKIISKINNAQTTIDMCAYNINRDPIVAALNAAVARGVVVRYIASSSTANLALQSTMPTFSVLKGNANALMHNKFIIIDRNDAARAEVMMGSMNFTQQNILDDFNNVLFIQDQSLARAYTLEFEEMWGSTAATPGIFAAKFGDLKTKNTPKKFLIDGIPMELYFSPSDGTTAAISAALQTANSKIEFATLTFTRNDLRDDIINAHNAGAVCRGIIENINDQGSEFATLQSAGVQMQDHPAPGDIHHKYAIIDESDVNSDPIVVTGSHNWSSAAETSNDENTLIIHDAAIANIFAQEFNARWLGIATGITTVRELTGFETSIFPNPVQETMNIEITSETINETTISIIDVSGKTIQTQILNNIQGETKHQIDVTNLSKGTYFVTFNVNGILTFEKMVKL